MIELQEAFYENFLGIREGQTLPLLHQGLTLIDGRNGTAKSTLPDGITWCFFGKTIRNLSNADKVVNRFAGKDCCVRVPFKVEDVPYVITRYRKHSKYKNRVIIEANGSDITLKDNPNEQIEKLLGGVDFKTFVRTLIFTKRDTPSLASLKDEQQKQLFEKIVGVDQLYEAYKKAKESAKQTRISIDAADHDMVTLRAELQRLDGIVKSLDKAHADFEVQKKERVQELKDRIVELESRAKSVEKTQVAIDDLEALSEQRELRVKKLRKRLKSTKEDVTKAENLRSMHSTTKMLTERQVVSLEEEVSGLFQLSNCPTCKQPLTKDHENTRKKQLAELKKRWEEETRTFTVSHNAMLAAQKKHTLIQEKFHKAQKALMAVESKLEAVRETVEKAAKQQESAEAELQTFRDRLVKAQTTQWGEVKTLKTTRDDMHRKQEELNEMEVSKRKHVKRLRYFDFWVQGFGRAGIPSDVINTVLPFLTQKTQQYLNRIADGKFKISFSTKKQLASGEERDAFTTKVVNKYGAGDYDGNSVGELGVVDLAITLAYQSLQELREHTRINVSFWDEVFDGADETSADSIVDLMSELSQKKDSLFVISHNSGLKASFPHVITMKKVGKTSRIVL